MGNPSTGASGLGKIDKTPQIAQLAAIANSFLKKAGFLFQQAKPIVAESSREQLEAMKTGGVGAQIPIIQRAVESSKAATANAITSTRDAGLASGVSGSYLQNILASTRMAGEQATSQIPTTIAQSIASGGTKGLDAITAALGFTNSALGADTSAAQLDLERQMANANQSRQFYGDLRQSIQDIAKDATGGGH